MDLTISIPDAIAERVVDNFCRAHGFLMDSGDDKTVFMTRKLKDYITTTVQQMEFRDAQARAESAGASIDIP